jgi:hypothetical protein
MENLNVADQIQPILEAYLAHQSYNQRGHYACYVVYRGRETGVFDTWWVIPVP